MRGVLIVALCALALAATGCGSSKPGASSTPSTSTTTSSGPRLSKAQYQARLTNIFQETRTVQSEILHAAETAKHVADVEAAVRVYATSGDHFASELEALNPPADAVVANAELARGERDNARETRAVLAKLSTFKTAHQALAYLDTLGQGNGSKEIDAALKTLKELGYATGT
jgi:hypothetical protein